MSVDFDADEGAARTGSRSGSLSSASHPHIAVAVPSTPTGAAGAAPHAVSFAASSLSGAVPPSPASSASISSSTSTPGPLQLPPHPTTPSHGSSEAALEAAAGINLKKLSPSDFLFGRLLGEGAFAKVVACTLRSDPSSAFACKIVDKGFVTKMGKIHTVLNEKKVLTLLHGHPAIVKLAYTFQDNVSLYYVMELAPGGEMYTDLKRVGKYSPELARFYTAQLIEVLSFIHGPTRRVVHRDLKPENILLGEGRHLKITDFGTARILTHEDEADVASASGPNAKKRRGSFVGTAEYVSPEILRDEMPTFSADLWSMGCIVFQMLTGRVPFKGASEYLTFQKILKRNLTWSTSPGDELDPDARDFIEGLLQLDPAKRLGAGGHAGGYAALKSHPFLAGIDFTTLFSQPVPPLPAPSTIVPEPLDAPSPYAPEDNEDDEEDREGDNSDSDEEWESRMAEANGTGAGTGGNGEASTPSSASAAAATLSTYSAAAAHPRPHPRLSTAVDFGGAGDSDADEEGDEVAPLPSSSIPHGPTVADKIAASGGGGNAPAGLSLSSRLPKMSTDGQYANSVWSKFLRPGEHIMFAGLVMKRRSIFARKRQLLLTSLPRLFYVDPERMEMKKEVAWSDALWAEVSDPVTFWIHTPGRDYYMKGLSSSSYCWVNEINNLQLMLKAAKSEALQQQ